MSRGSSAHLLRPLLFISLLASSCGGQQSPPQPLPNWEFGYWFWQGSSAWVQATAPIDTLYFQVRNGYLPERLPPAKNYWAVIRFDDPLVPTQPIDWQKLQAAASKRNIKLAGIQLDIDCPTHALRDYAKFLQTTRQNMPPEWQLSITALLDWFRPNTAIASVIQAVDEFVPQFYDLRNPGTLIGGPVIAAPIDAPKWAPVFNKFGRRFKIAISTFGRSRTIAPQNNQAISFLNLRPYDVGTNPAFQLTTSTTPAKEQVLRYRATRATSIHSQPFEAGTVIEFVLSTPEAIAASVARARQMGERCGGVLFFRWPEQNETMAPVPDEVLTAAGAAAIPARQPTLKVDDQRCAAVHCATLTIFGLPSLPAKPVRYRITSSADLEYFLPEKPTPVRMVGPRRLELTMPPYSGRMDVPLGRAVAAQTATYTLEVLP